MGRTQTEEIQLRIVASGNAAKKELAELAQTKDTLKRKIEGLNKGTKDYTATKKKLQTELTATNQRMRKLRGEIDLNSLSMRDLRNRSNDLKRVMDNMNPDTPEWKRLAGDLGKVNGRMRELRGGTSALKSSWDSAKQSIKAGIAAYAGIQGIRMLWNGAKEAVAGYITQQKAVAKVDQAIKSTAGAAGLSLSQLRHEAEALQEKTLFGDETIMNEATAQLLTFTNIANDEFLRTQRVALDLSTVLDGDLKSASIQLGKALNDPVANLSALSRSGIQFSKAQKEVIKDLANSNRLAEAQGVILDELERQYGGQAEAAVKAGGGWEQLSNLWGDVNEKIGKFLMDHSGGLLSFLKRNVTALNDLLDPQEKEVKVLERTRMEMLRSLDVARDKNLSDEARAQLIKEINTQYADYLPNLIDEKSSIEDLSKVQKELNSHILQKILYISYEEEISAILKEQIDSQKGLLEAEMTRAKLRSGELGDQFQDSQAALENMQHQLNVSEKLNQTIVENTDERATVVEDRYSKLAENMGTTLNAIKGMFSNVGTTVNEEAEKARAAIAMAKQDIAALQEMLGIDGEEGTEGERGGETTMDADEEFQAKLEKEIEDRAYFAEQIYLLQRTSEELEIEAANAYYDELVGLAEKYRTDTSLIEKKRTAEIAAIKKKNRKDEAKAEEISLKSGLNQLSSAMGTIEGLFEEGSAAQRSFALSKLAIDTAMSISSAIAGATSAAAATGPGAPFTLAAYIAGMIGTVVGSFVQAKQLLGGGKTKKHRKGTILEGPSHEQNGMAIIDQHGNKVAEVEGGEGLISKASTEANMPFIEAMLANPGKTIMPMPQFQVDAKSLQTSVARTTPSFRNGSNNLGNDISEARQSVYQSDSSSVDAINNLATRIAEWPDRIKADVSLTQMSEKTNDYNEIREFSDIRSSK